MHRTGHQRSVSVRASSLSPSDISKPAVVAIWLLDEQSFEPVSENSADSVHDRSQSSLELAIMQRIEARLSGRVRKLAVRSRGDAIVLEGECNTYYTKQLAQHAAMGILEDEHLENEIVVALQQ